MLRYESIYKYKIHSNNPKEIFRVMNYARHRKHHRTDGPAYISSNGNLDWFQYDQLHRTDGGPTSIINNGRKCWYKRNKLHRIDGPAILDSDGFSMWYNNGKSYRPIR